MSEKRNLLETLAGHDKFSTFTRYLSSSGANAVLDSKREYTVFAPTNDAFAKIPDKLMNEFVLETGQHRLRKLLEYHILPGRVPSERFVGMRSVVALTGREIVVSETDGIHINTATLQALDIDATDGLIHQIDTVLAPPATATAKGSSIL